VAQREHGGGHTSVRTTNVSSSKRKATTKAVAIWLVGQGGGVHE
jgi:hypothetical protein